MEESEHTIKTTVNDESDNQLPESLRRRYSNISVIGKGAAGIVFRAEDKLLNKVVAIKKLHNSSSAAQATRFHREARMLAHVNHPNIMSAIDFGMTSNNEPYLVLNYVEGKTLAQYLKKEGPMPVSLAISVLIEIAKGLDHAHSKDIVHRDIKPSNIMLVAQSDTSTTLAQIVDFGLARQSDTTQELTAKGVGVGTPYYMSPEQIRGQDIDARTDIYSFGCVMFEILTGRPPFRGESVIETMQMHLEDSPVSFEEMIYKVAPNMEAASVAGLGHIIETCLRKNVEQRYTDCSELLTDLNAERDRLPQPSTISGTAAPVDSFSDDKSRNSSLLTIALIMLVPLVFLVPVVALLTAHVDSRLQGNPALEAPARNSFTESTNPGSLMPEVQVSKKGEHRFMDADDAFLTDYLRRNKSITSVTIQVADGVTVQGLRVLRQRPDIKIIHLVCDKPVECIDELSHLTWLRKIGIICREKTKITSLDKLADLKELAVIKLQNFELTDNAFRGLGAVSKLKELNLTYCKGVSEAGLAELKRCKGRLSLEFNDTFLPMRSYSEIAQNPNLRNLNIKNTDLDYGAYEARLRTERKRLALPPVKISVSKKNGNSPFGSE